MTIELCKLIYRTNKKIFKNNNNNNKGLDLVQPAKFGTLILEPNQECESG